MEKKDKDEKPLPRKLNQIIKKIMEVEDGERLSTLDPANSDEYNEYVKDSNVQ